MIFRTVESIKNAFLLLGFVVTLLKADFIPVHDVALLGKRRVCQITGENEFEGAFDNEMAMKPRANGQGDETCIVPHVTVGFGYNAVFDTSLVRDRPTTPKQARWHKASLTSLPIMVINKWYGDAAENVERIVSKRFERRVLKSSTFEGDTLILMNVTFWDTGPYFVIYRNDYHFNAYPYYLEVLPVREPEFWENFVSGEFYDSHARFKISQKCRGRIDAEIKECLKRFGTELTTIDENYWLVNKRPTTQYLPKPLDFTNSLARSLCGDNGTLYMEDMFCMRQKAAWKCRPDEAQSFAYALARRWRELCTFDMARHETPFLFCQDPISQTLQTKCKSPLDESGNWALRFHKDFAKVWQLDDIFWQPLHDYCVHLVQRYWCIIITLGEKRGEDSCTSQAFRNSKWYLQKYSSTAMEVCSYYPVYYVPTEGYNKVIKETSKYYKVAPALAKELSDCESIASETWNVTEHKIGPIWDEKSNSTEYRIQKEECTKIYEKLICELQIEFDLLDLDTARLRFIYKMAVTGCEFLSVVSGIAVGFSPRIPTEEDPGFVLR